MECLQVENLQVILQKKEILKNITVSFQKAKRTVILGPNGCGKSTFLRTVSGLQKNYQGTIQLDGQDISSLQPKKLAQKVAVLTQGASVPTDLTVKELVTYGRFPYRSWLRQNEKEDRQAIAWAMEQTELEGLQDRLVATMSGGERQRAWIAMALAQQPEILLLDEPTTYLDIAHQLEVMQIIERLHKEMGITIIMVLHDINHALQYADALVVMKEGHIAATGRPQEILTPDLLASVFKVRAERFVNAHGDTILMPWALQKNS